MNTKELFNLFLQTNKKMKISEKEMKIVAGLFFIIGVIVAANINHWIGIFIMIAGMFFLMPWKKK